MDTRTQPLPVVIVPEAADQTRPARATPTAGRLSAVAAGVVAVITLAVVVALHWATIVSFLVAVLLVGSGFLVLVAALVRLALGSDHRAAWLVLGGVVVGAMMRRGRRG